MKHSGSALLEKARNYLDVPYVWGGKSLASGGLDCSGLVALAMKDLGLTIPAGTANQIDVGEEVSVADARALEGAMLWRAGHNSLSLGGGAGQIEAIPPKVTESAWTNTYNGGKARWTRARLLPGIDYSREGDMSAPVITSAYGQRTFMLNSKRVTNFHRGVDLRSPKGAKVEALFSGTVIRSIAGRLPGAKVGAVSNGQPALASSMSGNGTLVQLSDGSIYAEGHMSPSVKVGDKVEAGVTDLGVTDLSGSITAAHRHIERWRRNDPGSYYNPTQEVKDIDMPLSSEDIQKVALAVFTGTFDITQDGKTRKVSLVDALRAVYFYGDKVYNDTPARVWDHQLEHTLAKRADGKPAAVSAGTLLRYEPAEHANTRQVLVAAISAGLAQASGGKPVSQDEIDKAVSAAFEKLLSIETSANVTTTITTKE